MRGLLFVGLRFFYPRLESLPEFEVLCGLMRLGQVFGLFLVVDNMHRSFLLGGNVPGRVGVVFGQLKLEDFFIAGLFGRVPLA